MLKLIMYLYSGKWKLAFLTFIFMLVMAFDGIMFPYFLGEFTDRVGERNFGSIPLLMSLWFIIWLCLILSQSLFAFFLVSCEEILTLT